MNRLFDHLNFRDAGASPGHLSEADLVELCLVRRRSGDQPQEERPHAAGHLDGCRRCADRYARLEVMFEDVDREAGAEIDDHFPPERLEHQRQAIMRRIALLGRKGRLLRFPGRHQTPAFSTSARRWIATAAAAGLLVGMIAGQFLELAPRSRSARHGGATTTARPVAGPSGGGAISHASDPFNEEAFLVQVDAAILAPGVPELQALDQLTPR